MNTLTSNLILGTRSVLSVDFDLSNSKVIITFRVPSNMIYTCNPPRPMPDAVFKEIWGWVDGKLKLIENIQGVHHPAKQIPESFEFPP